MEKLKKRATLVDYKYLEHKLLAEELNDSIRFKDISVLEMESKLAEYKETVEYLLLKLKMKLWKSNPKLVLALFLV
jgi:hypothetical protein